MKKVRGRIAEIPQAYNQRTYFETSDDSPCGTAARIAGETIIVSQPSLKRGINKLVRLSGEGSVHDNAARLLGVTSDEACVLFMGDPSNQSSACGPNCQICRRWPEPFGSRYANAKTVRGRASAAVAYLDHIIETGKVLE